MLTLGQVVYTASISNATSSNLYYRAFILECVMKHLECDFGILCKENHDANISAIKNGGRILSIYLIQGDLNIDQEKIYINTEADRSYTTVLYPYEY